MKTKEKDARPVERPGYHNLFVRVPVETWASFKEFVEGLRPARTVTQQLVFLMEESAKLENRPATATLPPSITGRRPGRPKKNPA